MLQPVLCVETVRKNSLSWDPTLTTSLLRSLCVFKILEIIISELRKSKKLSPPATVAPSQHASVNFTNTSFSKPWLRLTATALALSVMSFETKTAFNAGLQTGTRSLSQSQNMESKSCDFENVHIVVSIISTK